MAAPSFLQNPFESDPFAPVSPLLANPPPAAPPSMAPPPIAPAAAVISKPLAKPALPKPKGPDDQLTDKLLSSANTEADTAMTDMAKQRQRVADEQPRLDAAAQSYRDFVSNHAPPEPALLTQRAPVYADFAQQVSPFAILLTALGGHVGKLSGSNILGAVTGLVEGTNEGNLAKYQSAYRAYKENMDAFQQEHANMNAYYNQMMAHQKDVFGAEQSVAQNALTMIGADQKSIDNALNTKKALDRTALELEKQWIQLQKINTASSGATGGLTPEETEALFGKNGAVTTGKLSPDKINSRTAHIYAQAYLSNPDTDMNALASDASLMRNPTFMNRQLNLQTLPEVMNNMVAAGKKVNYSDAKIVGEFQKFMKGQSNDPDLISYMAQRNDALMAIAATMRGVGMSDQAHAAEVEAANPTLSPRALDGWLKGQMTSLEPRLKMSSRFVRAGAHPDSTGAPQVPSAPSSGPVQVKNRAEAEALPPGTVFITPDGRKLVR